MRILRIRRGFQADHSSSSYLFYAVDKPVSAEGQRLAHRYSSRAEVDARSARYLKWGESELASGACEKLLGKHYDVMASESYSWWTLMIAVPKTTKMQELLDRFKDARGYDEQGVEVEEYDSRLVVVIFCTLVGDGADLTSASRDALEYLVELLAKVRGEILDGNVSFLDAVVSFYGGEEEEEEAEEPEEEEGVEQFAGLSKTALQEECVKRGIEFRKSWTKGQLLEALRSAQSRRATRRQPQTPRGKRPKLSRAARKIVDNLELV